MKQAIHPDYHPVVYRDRAANFAFLTRSTATSERTITWEDGRTYPVVDVEISSASHPFYTGQARVLDTAGRVEQFRRRYGTPRVWWRLGSPQMSRSGWPLSSTVPSPDRTAG